MSAEDTSVGRPDVQKIFDKMNNWKKYGGEIAQLTEIPGKHN